MSARTLVCFASLVIAHAAETPMLRRRLLPPGIPHSIDVTVPCTHNATVCGVHGECRSGECSCDAGWSSPTLQAPCSAEGPAQLKMALLQYFFGWFGLPAFLLGWYALGIATVVSLVLMCCSYCTWSVAEDSAANVTFTANESAEVQQQKQKKKARYERRQLCAGCVGGVSCCAWFWIWVVISVYVSISSHCATSSGAPCKGWRRL